MTFVSVFAGAVIGLEHSGPSVCSVCKETLESISKGFRLALFL